MQDGQPGLILAQMTYPWKVETPTHYAEFTTSKRYDRDLAKLQSGSSCNLVPENPHYNRKLDKITLYRTGGAAIAEVSFTYKDNGAAMAIADSNDARYKSMLSKLTLLEIKTTGMNSGSTQALPAYKFSYSDTTRSWKDIACDLAHTLKDYQDDFGFYWHDPDNPDASTYDDRDGRMWSLKEITYPEGGRLAINYENDVSSEISRSYSKYTYNPNTYQNLTAQFKRYRQGGPRVTNITKYDGYTANGENVIFFMATDIFPAYRKHGF